MELQIENLSKIYQRDKRAVDNISLHLSNGMFGLLGPNGAGKTTFMKMLATLLEPTKGWVTYNGYQLGQDNQAIRRLLGYLPQSYGLYPALTARENLAYMATLHGMPTNAHHRQRIDFLLRQVNLEAVADQRVGGFSGGMRQRLGIAQALLNEPALLIVDEPTAGLDPEERIRFRKLLGHLSGDRIVILSTHIVGDISSSCDDMAVLDQGQIRFRGRPSDLIEQVRSRVWQTTVTPDRVTAVEANYHVISAVRRTEGVALRLLGEADAVQGLPNLRPEEANLEDAYIWLIGQQPKGVVA
jgi:ABC-2 type transport system ATP-binding protein